VQKYDYTIGTKGTFIFVHGAGGDRSKWRGLMDGLAEGFGGLAIDLAGHGDSGGEAPTDMNTYALDLIQCVQEVSPARPFIWVGHSMGSGVVLTIALTKPEITDYLVLIGASGRLQINPAVLESIKNGAIDPAAKRLGFSPSTPDELIEKEIAADLNISLEPAYHSLLAYNGFDIIDKLPQINTPACIIVGKDDITAPPQNAELLLSKLPNASLTIVEKAGHMIILEQPEAINVCMKKFIEKLI